MRVAALYDIHGNLPALEAVLQETIAMGIDHIVVGGDVFPGPMPRRTIECLLDLGPATHFICGNGDREVLAQMKGRETDWYRRATEPWQEPVRWTARKLLPEHAALLESWPATCRLVIPPFGEVLFCHATPRNDTDVFTRLTSEDGLVTAFKGIGASLVVCGHTHMQFDRMVGGVRVVNAGSVGMPFGDPGAYWLLVGGDIQFMKTSYDPAQAADRIRNSDYPQARDFITGSLLSPPSEEEMLRAFAKTELKREG